MAIALEGQKHFTECKTTAPSMLPKDGAFLQGWKSKECLVLQCVLGIESCLLPVRCLVKAGTGLNATFATGALSFSSSQLRMYEHYPCTHSCVADLFNAIQGQTHSGRSRACCFPWPAGRKTSELHFRSGFLEQTACACKAS